MNTILLSAMILAAASGVDAREIITTKRVLDENRKFGIVGWVERSAFTKGEKEGYYRDTAHLKIIRKEDGERWESPINRAISIDAVVVTGEDEFVTITKTHNGYGHRVTRWRISDSLEPVEVEFERCYWPYVSPNDKWVFYGYWYPRTGTPEEYQHTSTWMLDITVRPFEPVLVYPSGAPSGREPDGRVHYPLTNARSPLWTSDSHALYYFEYLSHDYAWEGAEVFLIVVDISDPLTIEDTTAHRIDVADFAKPNADRRELAFNPVEMHWVDEEEGIIGGTLKSDPGWKSEKFYMTTEGEFVDPDVIGEQRDPVSGSE